MSAPFAKFVIHAESPQTFTIHVQNDGPVKDFSIGEELHTVNERRDFIEAAIREKMERENK